MRNILLAASAFGGLAAALPQMINIEAALAVPTPTVLGPKAEETAELPVTYDQVAAVKSAAAAVATGGVELKKRAACEAQPKGSGPSLDQGSVDEYLDSNNVLRAAARNAGTPTGYTKSFTDATGATEQIGYLTYKTLATYDPEACAAFCDSEDFCYGFNIFFERDPTVEPGPDCPNPLAQTNIKCSIYGYPVSVASATNQGQYRQDFHVVITGSNGYSKLNGATCKGAPTVAHFNAPANLPAAINAPLIQKDGQDYDTYNGMRLFNTNPYDPSLCAAACESQTAFDKEHLADAVTGEYKPCNFFTSYVLTKNGVPLGTYCALYTQSWSADYAVNTGYYYGDDKYDVICAASYDATILDSGKVTADTSAA